MRIVSGFLKGRRFDMPSAKWKTRPTTDYAKESLFNILFNQIELNEIEVLDLFSGTGNIAFEFASRGAQKVICVEKFGPCINFIQKHIVKFDLEEVLEIRKKDVFKFLDTHQQQYDVIFADPPYDSKGYPLIPHFVEKNNLLKPEGLLIIEHDSRQNFENYPNFADLRQYGQSFFSFLEY